MPPPANPDTRPLPSGWFQHYDPSRKAWYYVQTSVQPPKHSSIHPADMPGPGLSATPRQSPQLLHKSSQPLQGPKLSAAQKLYASANLDTGGAILSVPGEGGDIPSALRASPVPSHRSGPNPSVTPHSQHDGQHPRAPNSRTQSQGTIFTTATNPSNYYNSSYSSQRSSTFPSMYPSQTKLNSPAPLGGNQPRHIVTKAQPPSLLLSESFGAGATVTPPSQGATPAGNIGRGNALPTSPPVPVNIPDAAPVTPPYFSTYPQEKRQPIVLQVRNQSVSPTSPTQQAKRASVAALKNAGKQFGAAAAKFVASGVGSALAGIDVATLANALTGASFDVSGLQAVLQAQPNANYAAAIAALQQQQQVSPAADYALLINQIQQLQALAAQQQQQQQVLAMQLAQLNQNHAMAAAQQQPLLGGPGGVAPPHTTASPGYHQQQSPPPFHAPGHSSSPSLSTSPPAPPGYQPQSPPYPPQTSPPHTQSPTPSVTSTASSQDNLYQALQAQQAAASQQLQAQMQQYQQASQAQQQIIMAQIQQQSQAIQAQQQAAIAQAVQQQQQAQQQQNQALLNSFVPPPAPAQGPSFTDTMATYLNSALSGGQTDPAAATEVPPSYSGLMSSLGLGGDLSTLDLSADLTSSFGGLDLSSMSSDALSSFQYAV